jgi:hypothetical protein
MREMFMRILFLWTETTRRGPASLTKLSRTLLFIAAVEFVVTGVVRGHSRDDVEIIA